MNKIILRDEVAALSSRTPPSADTMQGWVTRNSIPSPWVPAELEARADDIRDSLLSGAIDPVGDTCVARFIEGQRKTVDQKALIEMFGEEAIAPFLKTTRYTTLKIVEK